MDFDLSDWTVDSSAVQLNKQLFGSTVGPLVKDLFDAKHQLTVPSVVKEGKKNRKRKSQIDENIPKKQRKHDETCNEQQSLIKGPGTKMLKNERKKEKLKQLKSDEKTEIKNDRKRIVEGYPSDKKKQLKRKYNTENHDDAESSERKKKEGKKNKTKQLIKEISINDNDVKQSTGEGETKAKKKRRKKKKNSSKKNKYKHLDEMRLAAKLSSNDKIPEQTTGANSEHSETCKENSSQIMSSEPKVKPMDKKAAELDKARKLVKTVSKGEKAISDFEKFKAHKNGKHKIIDGVQTKTKKSPFKVSTLQKVLGDGNSTSVKEKSSNTGKKEPVQRSVHDHLQKKEKDKHSAEKNDFKLEKDKHNPVSLRERMMEQLKSARFRYINEQLYTQTGSEAVQLFKDDKEAFCCYHEGFQNQVKKWPTNPVDIIIKQIKAGPNTAAIGDFGCGDAKIAKSVPNKVHSFDLVALNEHVTVCNIEKVPLKNSSLDIAVFCLSLMGTNLVEYLKEANRVLKKGGTLMIAEVTSRIQKIGKFLRNIENMGFQLVNKDTSNAMFILADFKKIGTAGEELPKIQLDPCVYKKR